MDRPGWDLPHRQLDQRSQHVPGGYYYNQHGPTGDGSIGHATAVYNADGTLADIPQNRGWQDVPRQDQG